MSTDTPDTYTDGGTEDENDPWDPSVLRRLAPDSLKAEGTRALVCAIRNPEATPGQIREKCGLGSTYTVTHALRSALVAEDREPVEYGQHVERRDGEARDAENYGELTDKQVAIIDFAAEHPRFVEDRSYADVAQALQEREGAVVDETYIGQVLRKYSDILQRQRALQAAEGENDLDLEEATSDMTVRETLEAAGFDLPPQNQDTMPEVEASGDTLGEAEQDGAEFQPASEREEAREAEGEGTDQEQDAEQEADEDEALDWLGEAWREQYSHLPGADRAQRLPDEAEDEDVNRGPYWAYVNGVASYGVFVSLTKPAVGDDVSGLVHEDRLHGTRSEYERGDPMVVELHHRNSSGLAFIDWRMAHPDEAADSTDSAPEEPEAEGTEDEQEDDVPTLEGDDYVELVERIRGLERAVDTLREDAVFASEVGNFADRVEQRLDGLEDLTGQAMEAATGGTQVEDLEQQMEDLEQEVYDALQNSIKADTQEQAEQNAQRLATLQEAVNALGEQVERATTLDGTLGRVQRDLQRLEAEGAAVDSYSFQQQDGTVTVHLQAEMDGTRQGTLDEVAQEDDEK